METEKSLKMVDKLLLFSLSIIIINYCKLFYCYCYCLLFFINQFINQNQADSYVVDSEIDVLKIMDSVDNAAK